MKASKELSSSFDPPLSLWLGRIFLFGESPKADSIALAFSQKRSGLTRSQEMSLAVAIEAAVYSLQGETRFFRHKLTRSKLFGDGELGKKTQVQKLGIPVYFFYWSALSIGQEIGGRWSLTLFYRRRGGCLREAYAEAGPRPWVPLPEANPLLLLDVVGHPGLRRAAKGRQLNSTNSTN